MEWVLKKLIILNGVMEAMMADKTIPQLEPKTTISSTDLIPVDDNTQTYKMTFANFLKAIPGVTNVALTQDGSGIVITFREGTPVTLVTHDSSKQNTLTFDSTPQQSSQNPVYSGGVYAADVAVAQLVTAEAQTARQAEAALGQKIAEMLGDLAEYEENNIASKAYHVNDLVVLNDGILYTAKEEIETNTQLVPDSNVKQTTIEEVFHRVKPVTEGGTGAETQSAARLNLGLGGAATKNVADTVAENDTKLPTGGAVYTAIKAVADRLNDLGLYVDSEGYVCQSIN